jgi:DNA-binding response OmpR family regulator
MATGQRILIVEDNSVISNLLTHLLERRGYEVQLASDGREAKDLIEKSEPPHLVVLDVILTHFDGFQLIEEMRSRDKWKDIPVIMLTSKNREIDIVRALNAGADDYMTKPFRPEELLARVQRSIKHAENN